MSQNNSLEYKSAMQNFLSMFPEIVKFLTYFLTYHFNNKQTLFFKDSELIEEILRLNQGSVEKTIGD